MRSLSALVFLLAPLTTLSAQKLRDTPKILTPEQFEARLNYQTGTVTTPGGLATLKLTRGFRYLDPAQTDQVLQKWGNPPNSGTLGMLVPAGTPVMSDEGWGVIISFDEDGYVNDDDAAKVDYPDLLKKMRQEVSEGNDERRKAGYPTIELAGWAERPHYDSVAHKLYWAKDLIFGGDSVHTLNYNIRVLGRRGVLVLNAVSTMDQIDAVRSHMANVITFVEFNEGHRYADFIPGTDKVAEYGIAALIAGGIAAKAGLFKVLLGVLIAAKKLVIVAVVAIGAFLRKLFGRKSEGPTPAA
jgi:uncharacterized membrane-anchored protein